MKYAVLVAVFLGFISVASSVASPAPAQGGSAGELRGISGTVCDKNDSPIPSAVVYLKNVRTLTVRTYISGDKGEYHFSGLDPNVDYEIHAEHDDLTSANHTLSSLDSRKDMTFTIKINKEKDKKKGDK
jgi:Carboxypeptidase regulatory-like domain